MDVKGKKPYKFKCVNYMSFSLSADKISGIVSADI